MFFSARRFSHRSSRDGLIFPTGVALDDNGVVHVIEAATPGKSAKSHAVRKPVHGLSMDRFHINLYCNYSFAIILMVRESRQAPENPRPLFPG